MGLCFFPRAGQVFVGDFREFSPPEINKIRPVIVISPRLPNRSELVAIVPISTTAPYRDLPFVFRLSRNYHPGSDDDLPCWAKCDLVMNISIKRLDAFKVGRRQYVYPTLTPEDLKGVRLGVMAGLGLDRLERDRD